MTTTPATRRIGGVEYAIVDDLLPAQARDAMRDAVLDAFAAAGVPAFVVATSGPAVGDAGTAVGTAVGIRIEHAAAARAAIADALPAPGMYLREVYPGRAEQPEVRLTPDAVDRVPRRCHVLEVGRHWSVAGDRLRYGLDYGCRIEFWSPDNTAADMWSAPIENKAGASFHGDYLTPATVTVGERELPSIALFERTFLDDVDFPIDVVYTWVDGNDPAWRERMLRTRAAEEGTEYHPEAQAANRYQSRDELKYSLRSLDMYAPWVRHVYLVTDGQVPEWLDPASSRITVVDHRDIYTDPSHLPVFNSSAIITQLHHIEGLAEHYLYFNDDMFVGSDARPEDFWYGSGVAKVFPSTLTRPFGPAHQGDAPHFNITKNIRAALEQRVGRSVTQSIQHTPYPQLRSVNYEIEERFGDLVNRTAANRFRHHDDIAQDQLFHYYAQATGRAVPSSINYQYVNVGLAESMPRLRRLLGAREPIVFCLNDAPEPGAEPMPDAELTNFLESYFPLKSGFEK